PLDAVAGVDRTLGGDLVCGALAQEPTLARVRALGVLPDHGHIKPAPDERAHVDVQVELEAQPQQQTPLEDAGGNVGCADRAQEDRVNGPQLVEDVVGEDLAGPQVPGAPQVVVDGVEGDAGGAHDLERLTHDFGPDAVA